LSFLEELIASKPMVPMSWLVLGDFNLIYVARDKSNLNLNRSLMGRFHHALDVCELPEFTLQNRRFTWSSERVQPTLVKLDRIFCNKEWDLLLTDFCLQALSSSLSDYCPLFLSQQP
jgi:endonuclease/exonuclease/phosphatase family metal-dependent hydrolase